MRICPEDTVLTLTSGGCNALNLLLNGAGHVVSVDCNPAQSALLELKAVAIQQLEYEDVWALFGEGVHPRIEQLFESRLAPFLTQTAYSFWSTRLWSFKQGLSYPGGLVRRQRGRAGGHCGGAGGASVGCSGVLVSAACCLGDRFAAGLV